MSYLTRPGQVGAGGQNFSTELRARTTQPWFWILVRFRLTHRCKPGATRAKNSSCPPCTTASETGRWAQKKGVQFGRLLGMRSVMTMPQLLIRSDECTSIISRVHRWKHTLLLPFNVRRASEPRPSFQVECLRHKFSDGPREAQNGIYCIGMRNMSNSFPPSSPTETPNIAGCEQWTK